MFLHKTRDRPLGHKDFLIRGQIHIGTQPVLLIAVTTGSQVSHDSSVVGRDPLGREKGPAVAATGEGEGVASQGEGVEGIAIPIRAAVRLLLEAEEIEKLVRASASASAEEEQASPQTCPPSPPKAASAAEESAAEEEEASVNETVLSYEMAMPLCLALRKWKRTRNLNALLLDQSTGLYPDSFRPLLHLLCDELFAL